MRACRTDKGVHAAGQVVSLKMLIKNDIISETSTSSDDQKEDEAKVHQKLAEYIQTFLPSDIRLFGIKRTTNSFHSKEECDSRFYEYLMPTYALASASSEPYMNPTPRPFREFVPKEEEETIEDTPNEGEPADTEEWVNKLSEEDMALMKNYKLEPEKLTKLRSFLKQYEGSKFYHNFTLSKSHNDPSSRRNIISVNTGNPFERDGLEWISIVFHGQSFMLHQIRKMVGLAILGIRLNCDSVGLINRCFQPEKVNIPKAPALGLLLDKSVYTNYNSRFGSEREVIDFDEYDKERVLLKDELIYPEIFEEEIKFNRFMGWLKCNDFHASEFQFLVPFMKSAD